MAPRTIFYPCLLLFARHLMLCSPKGGDYRVLHHSILPPRWFYRIAFLTCNGQAKDPMPVLVEDSCLVESEIPKKDLSNRLIGFYSRLKYLARTTTFLIFLSASTWTRIITTDHIQHIVPQRIALFSLFAPELVLVFSRFPALPYFVCLSFFEAPRVMGDWL
jgi:hypothetical protein